MFYVDFYAPFYLISTHIFSFYLAPSVVVNATPLTFPCLLHLAARVVTSKAKWAQCAVQKVLLLRDHSLNNYWTIILQFKGNQICFTGPVLCCQQVIFSQIQNTECTDWNVYSLGLWPLHCGVWTGQFNSTDFECVLRMASCFKGGTCVFDDWDLWWADDRRNIQTQTKACSRRTLPRNAPSKHYVCCDTA